MKSTTRLAISVNAILAVYFVSTAVIVVTLDNQSPQKTIIQKQFVVADEKRVIEVFISQLLEPKSAKCFKALLMRESHMNSKAKNPTSSSKGVGQLLSGTYKNLGMRHSDDGLSQTIAALAYVSRRYGSSGPCGAWRHSQEKGWY